jgi:hypothetical protein
MYKQAAVLIFSAVGAAILLCLTFLPSTPKTTKVHKLESPLLLSSNTTSTNMHMLPKGTVLYFDQSYPEGFTRYKVYVNIDRMPLKLSELADPTLIDPLEAKALDQADLKKLPKNYPLTKQDLSAILKSSLMSKEEIKDVLTEFVR